MEFNFKAFNALTEEGKWEEAKKLLEEHVNALSEADLRGASYLRIAGLYTQVMNAINREYEATLDDAIDALRALKKRESRLEEAVGIDEARKKLQSNAS